MYLCTIKVKQLNNISYGKKTIHLIDTFDCGLEYADYVDFCEANEITPSDENSNDYYEWLGEERNRLVEDFFDNLKHRKVMPASKVCKDRGTA